MLEFIVLGQIPGSHTQLTFGNVMMLWIIFLALLFAIIAGKKYKEHIKTEAEMLQIYLILRFGRKSALARGQNTLPIKLKLF